MQNIKNLKLTGRCALIEARVYEKTIIQKNNSVFRAIRWCIGLLATCLALTVSAQDFESTKQAAWQGNARAQYKLGLMYAKGRGVTHNDAEAMQWYRKAAQQGDEDAKAALDAMKKSDIVRAYDVDYLKEGMNASVARKFILKDKWVPNRSRHSRETPMWGIEKLLYQKGFSEIDSCAVDGPWCLLKYKKDQVCLEVEIEGQRASRMRVTAWTHDCEFDS